MALKRCQNCNTFTSDFVLDGSPCCAACLPVKLPKVSKKYNAQWKVPNSAHTKSYIVSLPALTVYECSCTGWTSHVPRKDCKHIRLVRAHEKQVAEKIKNLIDQNQKVGSLVSWTKKYAQRCVFCNEFKKVDVITGQVRCWKCEWKKEKKPIKLPLQNFGLPYGGLTNGWGKKPKPVKALEPPKQEPPEPPKKDLFTTVRRKFR